VHVGAASLRKATHQARAELPSRQRARQHMEGLELDVRLAGHVTRGRHCDSRRTPHSRPGRRQGQAPSSAGMQPRRENLTLRGLGLLDGARKPAGHGPKSLSLFRLSKGGRGRKAWRRS
jgi:hypothetical protein